jgi:long-chain acyl-CoA synthetase
VRDREGGVVGQTSGRWYPGAHVEERADHLAVVHVPSGRTQSYGQLEEVANQMSHLLRNLSLDAGDHVSLWFDNEHIYPSLWWGAHYAGLYYTLISARLTALEAAYIVGNSESKVLVVGRRLYAEHGIELTRLLGDTVRVVVDDDSSNGLASQLRLSSPAALTGRTEGSPMLYSSGTTGLPRAARRALTGMPLGSSPGVAELAVHLFGMNQSSVYLSPAPLYHAAPYAYVTAATSLGATAVVMEHFDPELCLATIERFKVTHIQLVPTMFVRLLALPCEVRARYELKSLRCAIHAAAPCAVPVKQAMMDWWGPIIHEYYSGTEGVGMTYCPPEEWLSHKGTVGRAIMGSVHVVDDEGQEVSPGIDGTVYFDGGQRFEYFGDSEKTASSYLPHGWATFGDIGHLDKDGFLYLTDRRADLIIVGGVNVYPQEAENILISHPCVLDAAVFGIPNHEWGGEVKAVVQLMPGVARGPDMEQRLIAACRAVLAAVKCPRSIEFRQTLPREPNGKLLRRVLRAEFAANVMESVTP